MIADNVPFNSAKLKGWARKWGFQPLFRSPEYPQSTGQSEKAVLTAKMLLKKTEEERSDLYLKLLEYRNTPIAGLHLSPAQLMFNRRPRTRLLVAAALLNSELFPVIQQKLSEQQ